MKVLFQRFASYHIKQFILVVFFISLSWNHTQAFTRSDKPTTRSRYYYSPLSVTLIEDPYLVYDPTYSVPIKYFISFFGSPHIKDASASIQIKLSKGLTVDKGELNWKGRITKNETLEEYLYVKVPKPGDYTITFKYTIKEKGKKKLADQFTVHIYGGKTRKTVYGGPLIQEEEDRKLSYKERYKKFVKLTEEDAKQRDSCEYVSDIILNRALNEVVWILAGRPAKVGWLTREYFDVSGSNETQSNLITRMRLLTSPPRPDRVDNSFRHESEPYFPEEKRELLAQIVKQQLDSLYTIDQQIYKEQNEQIREALCKERSRLLGTQFDTRNRAMERNK
ncbi:MAG: hypothetical protein OEM52_07315 [bacterium]|nr:hypothetical protein [bacterium]